MWGGVAGWKHSKLMVTTRSWYKLVLQSKFKRWTRDTWNCNLPPGNLWGNILPCRDSSQGYSGYVSLGGTLGDWCWLLLPRAAAMLAAWKCCAAARASWWWWWLGWTWWWGRYMGWCSTDGRMTPGGVDRPGSKGEHDLELGLMERDRLRGLRLLLRLGLLDLWFTCGLWLGLLDWLRGLRDRYVSFGDLRISPLLMELLSVAPLPPVGQDSLLLIFSLLPTMESMEKPILGLVGIVMTGVGARGIIIWDPGPIVGEYPIVSFAVKNNVHE